MGKRNFYFKYFLPRLEVWALFCGLFGFFFIVSRSRFESPDIERIFIFVWLFYIASMEIFAVLFHGGARFLKLKIDRE